MAHVFMYGTDRCVDMNGIEWCIMTWQPTYFVVNNQGKYQHVLYHHLAKHVKVDKEGKRYTGWSDEDKQNQFEDFDYVEERVPFVIYNARTWAKVSTIPKDMKDRAAMIAYSERSLRQALFDDENMKGASKPIPFDDDMIDFDELEELQA
jgi:hypothetical protein